MLTSAGRLQAADSNNRHMEDWKSYFKSKLTGGGKFIFTEEAKSGELEFLYFKSARAGNDTAIEITLEDGGYLSCFEVFNPKTPGFNDWQEGQFFDRNTFDPKEPDDDTGLAFTDVNRAHFDKFLSEGLKGREVQYYRKGTLIKSDVYQGYADNRGNDRFHVVEVARPSVWDKVLKVFGGSANHDEQREVQLHDIFNGIG